ncbi:hypothetical protein H9635_19065, partial [Solibacillus sp. A46]
LTDGLKTITFESSEAGTLQFIYQGKKIGPPVTVQEGTNKIEDLESIIGAEIAGAVGNKEALDKVDIAALTSGNLLQVELTDGAENSTIYTINVTKNLDVIKPTVSNVQINGGTVTVQETKVDAELTDGLKTITFESSEAGTLQFIYQGKKIGPPVTVQEGTNKIEDLESIIGAEIAGAVGNKEALDKVDIAALTSGNLLQV